MDRRSSRVDREELPLRIPEHAEKGVMSGDVGNGHVARHAGNGAI
jgi:hypothetical protein